MTVLFLFLIFKREIIGQYSFTLKNYSVNSEKIFSELFKTEEILKGR
jgi:hypothetical protein